MSDLQSDHIYSASVESAIRHELELANRCAKRIAVSKTPDSNYCRELKELEKMHRAAAMCFSAWRLK